ncbi:MAG: hypothetical protein V3S02_04300 [Dehalococcoidales bacterium]
METRKEELDNLVDNERSMASLATTLPEYIKGFVEAFEGLDIRQQEVQLQSILKAAHI